MFFFAITIRFAGVARQEHSQPFETITGLPTASSLSVSVRRGWRVGPREINMRRDWAKIVLLLDSLAKFSQVLACSQNVRIFIKIVSIGRNFVSGVVISFVLFVIRSEQVSVASPIVQAVVSPIALYRRNLLTTCEKKKKEKDFY